MTARPSSAPADSDVRAIEELLRALSKGQRALQMYLPNNPVYQRAMEQVADAFGPIWGITGRLILDVQEDQITWDEVPVYHQPSRSEGLAWQLYKDGVRRVTLLPGVEADEIQRFLQVLNRSRMLPADAGDDLLTLLWEQEFVLISYLFVEVLGDGIEFVQESHPRDPTESRAGGGASARDEVDAAPAEDAEGAPQPDGTRGTVDLSEFDATPYFLDDAEIRLVQSELDEEYRRDIRDAAIAALLDILESQADPAVRREVVDLLDEVLPGQLSTGGFRAVARILRELRVIAARAAGLDQDLHRAVLSFEERLSTPEVLEHLFSVLEDMTRRPADDDIGEVMRELKPTALPIVLGHLGRIADPAVRRVLESSVESIARSRPQAISEIFDAGDDATLIPAIALVGRLGLTQLLPAIIGYLETGDEATRAAAVRVLGDFGTPTAVAAIEKALADPERGVRQLALTLLMERGGSGGLLRQLDALLFDDDERAWERSERRTLFEAYGQIGTESALPRLRDILEPRGLFRRKRSPEVRACAIFALGKVRTFDARMLVDRFTADREPVVRSAANAVLRDWLP